MSVYVLRQNEKVIYISVNPSFTIYNLRFKGYKFHGHVTVILLGVEIIHKSSSFMFHA